MTALTVSKPFVSFLGDAAVKEKYLNRVRAHRVAEEIAHGVYWEKRRGTYKGCAVGCTLHSNEHTAYETELGIPVPLAYIQDGLFERMRRPDDVMFPEQFLEAIPVGVDLYPALWRFMLFVLIDERNGLVSITKNNDVFQYIPQVASFYQAAIEGTEIDIAKYRAAWNTLNARNALNATDPWAARAARAAMDALNATDALNAWSAMDTMDALNATDARAAWRAMDTMDALNATDARAARALVWRDELLKCLREAK